MENEDQKVPLFLGWGFVRESRDCRLFLRSLRPNVFGTLFEPKDETGTVRARGQINVILGSPKGSFPTARKRKKTQRFWNAFRAKGHNVFGTLFEPKDETGTVRAKGPNECDFGDPNQYGVHPLGPPF